MAETSGNLPPELMRDVIYHLIHGWVDSSTADRHMNWTFREWGLTHDATRYAAVNRCWQDVIERETFSVLRLDAPRLLQLNSIVHCQRRRSYVQKIHLEVVLPAYATSAAANLVETDQEKEQNNTVLQATTEAFFSALGSWTVEETCANGLELVLDACSVSDEGKAGEAAMAQRRGNWHNLWDRRYSESVLELRSRDLLRRLPSVQVITQMSLKSETTSRRISGATVATILAKLPRAVDISLELQNASYDARRRADFAEALLDIQHPIDTLHIADTKPTEKSESQPHSPPVHTQRIVQEDALSGVLFLLSQRVESLSLYGLPITSAIFWPPTIPPTIHETSRWHRLQAFSVYYPPISPTSGLNLANSSSPISHVTKGSQHYSESSEPGARDDTSDELGPIQRFYMSAGRAALEMPLLKDMTLVEQFPPELEEWHKFCYHVEVNSSALVIWTSSDGFEPQQEVLDVWRSVPQRHLKLELEVQILQDETVL
ncbi:putative f-box domain protein [Seiridium unicorne]|uniref:F-box domain protein n=1 Tax=Seiridium unicorne TaxID=138068 RepID=A0ABR2VFR1_9PEZI